MQQEIELIDTIHSDYRALSNEWTVELVCNVYQSILRDILTLFKSVELIASFMFFVSSSRKGSKKAHAWQQRVLSRS